MVVTGLAALALVNIALFRSLCSLESLALMTLPLLQISNDSLPSALRRGVTLIVLISEYMVLKKAINADESFSVLLMVVGALVAGAGDLSWSFVGYSLTLLNCVVTSGYLVYIKKTSQSTKLDELTMMLYNNLLSMPAVLIVIAFTEIDLVMAFPLWYDPGFLVRNEWLSSCRYNTL